MTAHKHRRGWPVFAGRVGFQKRQPMESGAAASTGDIHSDDYR